MLTSEERRLLNTLRSMGSKIVPEGRKNAIYCTSHGVQPYTTINAFGAVRMLCTECVEIYWHDPPPEPESLLTAQDSVNRTCLECGSEGNGILNMHTCVWCQRDVCGACIDWANTLEGTDKNVLVCESCSKDLDGEIADLLDRQIGE